MADKKMIKIIQIDGRKPRKASGYDNTVYEHKDHQTSIIDKDGNESTAFFAVFELPEMEAHQKIAGASSRYVPFMSGDIECKVPSGKGSIEWKKFRETKFEIKTETLFDPETGSPKVNAKGNPVFVKINVLKDSAGNTITAIPYRVEVKEQKAPFTVSKTESAQKTEDIK